MTSDKWAFTVKWNSPKGMTHDELTAKLDELVEHWKVKGVELLERIDEDRDKRGELTPLHMHGVISVKRGLYRKKLCLPGFHVKLVSLYLPSRWSRYCNKNSNTRSPVVERSDEHSLDHIPCPKYSLFKRDKS